ncbi:hypothetical protein QBC39DRAFT_369112 [Podospora conica]|nr:hypothetical protein QBC39DRAFT_369112 [Schizothecium conicum]
MTPKPDQNPLSNLTPLSPNISIFHPPPSPSSSPTSPTPPPKLIILLPPLSAPPAPIATHLTFHRSLFPTTPILLVRTPRRHLLLPSLAFRELAAFAAPVIRATCPITDDSDDKTPDILMHALSAGGASALGHLRALMAPHMPPHVVVFDSVPGRSVKGELLGSMGGGRFWSVWFWGLVVGVWLWVVGRFGRVGGQGAGVHNERGGRARGEVRRTYVYYSGDGREVEAHAEEARVRGFEVRMERFEGTGGVVGCGRGEVGSPTNDIVAEYGFE